LNLVLVGVIAAVVLAIIGAVAVLKPGGIGVQAGQGETTTLLTTTTQPTETTTTLLIWSETTTTTTTTLPTGGFSPSTTLS